MFCIELTSIYISVYIRKEMFNLYLSCLNSVLFPILILKHAKSARLLIVLHHNLNILFNNALLTAYKGCTFVHDRQDTGHSA